MSKANNLTDFLVNTADAIRTAEGSTALINPQDFESHILALGGGITPTGNIELTTNLSTDVSSYATATVRSASGYSLSASGNSSTDVTVGSISGQYYPVSATLTGSLTASTPGWFSSSGTISAGSRAVGRIKKALLSNQPYNPQVSSYLASFNGYSLNQKYIKVEAGYLPDGYIWIAGPTPLYPFGNYMDSYSADVTDTTMIQRNTDWQITVSMNDNYNDSVPYYVAKTVLFNTSSTTTSVATATADGTALTFTAGGIAVMLSIWTEEQLESDNEWSGNLIIKNAYGQEIVNLENDYDDIYGYPGFVRGWDRDISNSDGSPVRMSVINIMIYWAYDSKKMNIFILS